MWKIDLINRIATDESGLITRSDTESDMAGAGLDVPSEFSLLEVAKAAGGVAFNYPMKTIQQEPFYSQR